MHVHIYISADPLLGGANGVCGFVSEISPKPRIFPSLPPRGSPNLCDRGGGGGFPGTGAWLGDPPAAGPVTFLSCQPGVLRFWMFHRPGLPKL